MAKINKNKLFVTIWRVDYNMNGYVVCDYFWDEKDAWAFYDTQERVDHPYKVKFFPARAADLQHALFSINGEPEGKDKEILDQFIFGT